MTRFLYQGSVHDYAMMEDHKRHLMNDTSVLHFYFGKLRSERKRAFNPPPDLGTLTYFLTKEA